MELTINGQIIETNPTGITPAVLFLGTVHNGTEQQIDVYGFNENDIMELANKIKEADHTYNTVHIYGPENIWSPRTYVGVKFLG